MQIDETIRYDRTIPADKGYLFDQKKKAVISDISLSLSSLKVHTIQVLKNVFSDLGVIRLVIFVSTVACYVMGYVSDDKYHFKEIAYSQAAVGAVALIVSATRPGVIHIRRVGSSYIHLLNLLNIANVALSHFNDKISYQFVIYFFVTNLFFNNTKDLLISIVLNSSILLSLIFWPSENSSSLMDFYLSFIISAFALVVLMMKRFKTEANLAENELKYRLLAENSADIICTHKPDGEFDFVSPSIASLTGYDPSELTGLSASRFVYPDDRHLYNEKIKNPDIRDGSDVFQYRFLTKGGQYIWLETVVRGMGDHPADGIGSSFLSQTRSFQRHHEYLEQIEKQTADLQESYKDLEMFAYISSHDMQEPLRMISNYMQLLKRKYETRLDKDAMEYIEYAVKGASNLQALIKDLLSYSTINKKEISCTPVDMESLLDDVLSGLQLLMQERNVKVFINEPMRPVLADKNAMTQLVQNLIQNGIKYNTSAAPVIRIICTEDAKNITYCIQDNGIGIDKQYALQIFEPFQRLHNKHNFPGTGLGLSICRKIVDRLNGKIWVESEAGAGSSFFFSIPKVHEPSEA